MTHERYRRAKEVFQAAIDLDPHARRAFVNGECRDDEDLRREIESLLKSAEAGSGYLERPALGGQSPVPSSESGESQPVAGRRVGAYELIREIGRGGMGVVYLARRADPELPGQVALKLVKRGMDTDFILRRFRTERRILAGLAHPNIARFLDGGATEDGLPYFVMEYIEGEHILDYCDRRRLSTRERLELFHEVCGAVQYAHTQLVVHRDIKPSNIMITAGGVPQLLDFGVAKLLGATEADGLSPAADATATALRILTPEYASPEQVRGERVTTASDVYSLGVLLYRLLTGRSPYRATGATAEDLARAVCEAEPERPSVVVTHTEEASSDNHAAAVTPEMVVRAREGSVHRLRRALAGDLDVIVMTALRKEPERRYASAEQFGEDVRRHLAGLPVAARGDTASYRAGKFVRRHRLGVAAAGLVAASLLAGIVATSWQARVARMERARAERRFNDVRALATSFLFEFHDAIKDLAGATPARELLVKRALQYLDGLAQESQGDPSLQSEIAAAYERVGDVQGNPYYPNLGNTRGALASYARAEQLLLELPHPDAPDPAVAENLVDLLRKVGITRFVGGDAKGAVAVYGRAVSLARGALGRHGGPADRRRLATSLGDLAWARQAIGETAAAIPLYREALPILEELSAGSPADDGLLRNLAAMYERTAGAEAEAAPAAPALAMYRKAVEIRTQLASRNATSGVERQQLAVSLAGLGELQESTADLAGALASYQRALTIDEELVAKDSNNAQAMQRLATDLIHIGAAYLAADKPRAALPFLGRAVEICEHLVAGDPPNAANRAYLATALEDTGEARIALAALTGPAPPAWRSACSAFSRSQELFRTLVRQGFSSKEILDRLARLDGELRRCKETLEAPRSAPTP